MEASMEGVYAEGRGGEEGEEAYMVATTEEVRRALEGELVDGGLEVVEGSRCRQQGGSWQEEQAVQMIRGHFKQPGSRRGGTVGEVVPGEGEEGAVVYVTAKREGKEGQSEAQGRERIRRSVARWDRLYRAACWWTGRV